MDFSSTSKTLKKNMSLQTNSNKNIDESTISEIKNKLKNLKSSLIQSPTNFYNQTEEIKSLIYDALYRHLSQKILVKEDIPEITELLFHSSLILQKEQNDSTGFNLLENLLILFLVHFDYEINRIGFSIIKFFLENIEYEYHKELLMNLIRLVQILNIKRSSINPIASFIISNISFCIILILNITSTQVKKIFIDFIKKNSAESTLIYLLLLSSEENLNLSNCFTNDTLYEVLERFKLEFEKSYKQVDSFANNNNKNDGTISSKSQMKQYLDKLGLICKIINSFIIRGHKPYNIDKIMKNLIPNSRKLITLLYTKIDKSFNISCETIHNIISFAKSINSLDTEQILNLIKWIKEIYESNSVKYILNIEEIIQLLISYTIIDQNYNPNLKNLQTVSGVILQIIETILGKGEENIAKISIVRIYTSLLQLNPNLKIDINLYPKTYEFFIQKKLNDLRDFSEENLNYYSKIYLNSLGEGENKNFDKKYISDCLDKFEQFKNSMKTCYSADNISLDFETKIKDFKNKIDSNQQVSIQDFENFVLECSIQMYTEIFNQKNN